MTDKVQAVNTKLVDTKSKKASFSSLASQKASSAQRTAASANARRAREASLSASGNGQVNEGSSTQKNGQITQTVGQMTTQTGGLLITIGMGVAALAATSKATFLDMGCEQWAEFLLWTGGIISAAGIAITAVGTAQVMSGNDEVNEGNATLAKAANEGIISNQQASQASIQLERASFYEAEVGIADATIAELESQQISLSSEEKDDLRGGINESLKKGATTLRDGGILSLKNKDGEDQFFMRDDNGDVNEVDVKRKDNGEVDRDEFGALQFDRVLGPVDQNDPMAKEIAINFAVADSLKQALEGGLDDGEGGTYPARTRLKFVNGEIEQVPYDTDSPVDMNQLIDIFDSIEKHPPEFRLYRKDGELGMQKWDYENNQAQSGAEFVSIVNGFGTKEQAKETLKKLGVEPGTPLYEELTRISGNTEEGDSNYDPNKYRNILAGVSQRAAEGRTNNDDLFGGLRTGIPVQDDDASSSGSNALGGA